MPGRRWMARGVLMVGSLALAACSTSSTTTSTTAAGGTTSTTGGSSSTTAAASATATNLLVTDQTRTQLVAAASALQGIPVAQFSGLAPGLTFYALDKTTGIRWAGARLVAAPVPDGAEPLPGPGLDPGRRLVLRVPAARRRSLDGVRGGQHWARDRLPGDHPAGGPPGVGMAGRRLSTTRGLNRPGWHRTGQSVPGARGERAADRCPGLRRPARGRSTRCPTRTAARVGRTDPGTSRPACPPAGRPARADRWMPSARPAPGPRCR